MNAYFDESETSEPSVREAELFAGFGELLKDCATHCPGLAAHLAEHDLHGINSMEALRSLPVLRKSDLMAAQQAAPPFGGFVRESALQGRRIFMSPGPVWEPQLGGSDPWLGARALFAAGIRAGDRVHNAFSYHLTPGGFILDEAARAMGCVVFPAGVGNTEAQVMALRQTQASVYVGTPDYLQILLDHASAENQPLSGIKRALVSGGALFPAMRAGYEEQGIHVQQCYATADLGVIGYESSTDDQVHPGMVVNEGIIVEILVPGTAIPVAPGEVGEVVVTRLDKDYPLVRFGTGDLSKFIDEPSPCGRTNKRLAGWMGRADQRVKVKGMFVDPVQLGGLRKLHPELDGWRLVISRVNDRDAMTLQVTLSDSASGDAVPSAPNHGAWLDSLSKTLKQATNLGGEVCVIESLPADGIVVDDQRNYD